MKNITKKTQTILFASLIAAMVLPFASSDVAYGFTDEYTKAWEKLDTKLILIEEKIIKIKEKLENPNLSEKRILKLNDRLSNLLDKEARLIEKINILEQKSIDSFVVDSETKAQLESAEQFVYEKYINEDSDIYIGANPINFVIADFQDKQLLVLVDEILSIDTASASLASSVEIIPDYLQDIVDQTGINLEVEVAEFVDTACSSRTSNCSPMVAGISVAKSGVSSGDSTIAFKATNTSGKTGFVMAGHAGNVGDSVYQRAGGNYAGQIITESSASSCDCAFVESSRSMSNSIWKNYRQSYSINQYAVPSDFVSGMFLKKSGVTTGVTYGNLISSGGTGSSLMSMTSASGDSGAPVFTTSGNYAELFGMIKSAAGSTYSVMEPYPVIKSNLNLQ